MPVPQSIAPLERICLGDAAYERLREWILDGTLAPGEALRDEALAASLGMSRTPVREALRRLEDEGLVVTVATRRTYVSPVTARQAREIYPIIAPLEALALRLALPQIGPAQLDAMTSANDRLAEALAARHPATATAADEAVHRAFVECCGNGELRRILGELRPKVRRLECAFWGSADRSPSLADHAALIEALRTRDAEQARKVLARNWERGLDWIAGEATEQEGAR